MPPSSDGAPPPLTVVSPTTPTPETLNLASLHRHPWPAATSPPAARPQPARVGEDAEKLIKKICPPSFDAFIFLPSVGASGGIINIWKTSLFDGQLVFQNEYAISVEFVSRHNNM